MRDLCKYLLLVLNVPKKKKKLQGKNTSSLPKETLKQWLMLPCHTSYILHNNRSGVSGTESHILPMLVDLHNLVWYVFHSCKTKKKKSCSYSMTKDLLNYFCLKWHNKKIF